MKKLPLYITILLGMAAGIALGFVAVAAGWERFVADWIRPWGTVFIRSLRLVAVPLVIVSLVSGISNLSDIRHLSRIGVKTLGVYLTMFSRSKTVCKNLLAVFVFSLIVEIIQYTFKLGIGDIDDIILNCLGGFIGIGIYQLLLRALRDTAKVRRIVAVAAPVVGVLSFLFLYLYNVR